MVERGVLTPRCVLGVGTGVDEPLCTVSDIVMVPNALGVSPCGDPIPLSVLQCDGSGCCGCNGGGDGGRPATSSANASEYGSWRCVAGGAGGYTPLCAFADSVLHDDAVFGGGHEGGDGTAQLLGASPPPPPPGSSYVAWDTARGWRVGRPPSLLPGNGGGASGLLNDAEGGACGVRGGVSGYNGGGGVPLPVGVRAWVL